MENNTAKYKFNTNLLKASKSINLEDAKKEWKIIYEEKREENDGLCICQRKVKNIIYMYNIQTQNTIIVGTVCCKKFEMNKDKLSNTILYNLLKNNLIKGEYTNINNIITYCNSVKEQLIQHIQEEFETIINNYNQSKNFWDNTEYQENWNKISFSNDKKLKELSININELIQQYNLDYLKDIYLNIKNKLNEMNEEIKKYEKSKIYYVRKYVKNYIPGAGTDIFGYQYRFISLENCNEYISKQSNINYTKYSGYYLSQTENTILKIEILLNDIIIKTITTTQATENLDKLLSQQEPLKWNIKN